MTTRSEKKQAREQAEQDRLRAFYQRRHPAYFDSVAHWTFVDACYEGGREWFESNIFKYFKEGATEYAARVARAYRFNHTKEVVELVQKYLFKASVGRNDAEAPEIVRDFWKRTSLRGGNIDHHARIMAQVTSICGRAALVIDNNFPSEVETPDGETRPLSVAEAAAGRYRIYAYVVKAQDVLDYAWDEEGDGGLLWIKLRESFRDDIDPHTSSGLTIQRVRLYTRKGWELYEETEVRTQRSISNPGPTTEMVVKLIDSGTYDFGEVPVKLIDHTITEDPYQVPGLIDDIAYLDRTVANYLSNLDAIIQDQTFSQLAIPAQAVQPGDDMMQKVQEMGTKRVFVYDAGAGSTGKPEFISPDPKQAATILQVINKIISEIYHTIGLAGERTKEDNAVGIDNSSGVAKAYDFERVNSLLLAKAAALELAENWMVRMVCLWSGQPVPEADLVTYPKTFDVMRLADELAQAEALAKVQGPIELRRAQMRVVAERMLPQIDADTKEKIKTNIDEWLEGTDVLLPPTTAGAPTGSNAGGRSPGQPSRQGQVTPKTPSTPAKTDPKSAGK